MLVPVSEVVPHAPVLAETVPQPGVMTSGLRRPSAVGPVPPEQNELTFGVSCVAPTASRFFAFSGFFSVPVFVVENSTRFSSLFHGTVSIELHSES